VALSGKAEPAVVLSDIGDLHRKPTMEPGWSRTEHAPGLLRDRFRPVPLWFRAKFHYQLLREWVGSVSSAIWHSPAMLRAVPTLESSLLFNSRISKLQQHHALLAEGRDAIKRSDSPAQVDLLTANAVPMSVR
jgi:hypothetical protein